VSAPRVVTGREMMEALCDANGDNSNWAHCPQSVRDKYNGVAARLTARAGAALPLVVVRRPVERPSAFLAAPSAGLYVKRSQDGEISGPVRLPEGCLVGRSVAAICRVDTDAPTWIERPAESTNPWTEADVPSGHLAYFTGKMWATIHADTPAYKRAEWLNRNDAVALCVLPTLDVSP